MKTLMLALLVVAVPSLAAANPVPSVSVTQPSGSGSAVASGHEIHPEPAEIKPKKPKEMKPESAPASKKIRKFRLSNSDLPRRRR